MATALSAHIYLDERGIAWIDETNVKVVEVVLDKLAHGSSSEEIHFQYPHLSLAQIHAALAYYYDHQSEIDAVIASQLEEADSLAKICADSPLRKKLRQMGSL
jgi:uncharacterized protein (DUF433 family)